VCPRKISKACGALKCAAVTSIIPKSNKKRAVIRQPL
jgi:hypothetical protein